VLSGFSDNAIRILNAITVDYHTVNILQEEKLRSAIKLYSDWPTIPQLYVAGEFIGGADIMWELYKSGELRKLIVKAQTNQSTTNVFGDEEEEEDEENDDES